MPSLFCVTSKAYSKVMCLTNIENQKSTNKMCCPFLHRDKIVNPLAEKFANKYLPRYIESSDIRSSILSDIKSYFQQHPKQHYLMKQIVAIQDDSEIPGVKESKHNICKLCFNHASKSHTNPHLRAEHRVNCNFLQHAYIPSTTG